MTSSHEAGTPGGGAELAPTERGGDTGTVTDCVDAPSARSRQRSVEFGWVPVGGPSDDADRSRKRLRMFEVYVTDHFAARLLSAALAVGVAFGTVAWVREAADRFDGPALVCAGCVRPDWFRWSQLLVAVIGIALAIVQVAYLANFVVRGVVWRRWRGVSVAFGALAGAWTLMWWWDHFWK